MGNTVDQTNALSVEAIEGGAECMGRLADSFEASARRWELIVYPSLVAFILLAAYGFFLIYNLTRDISDVAKNVHEMTISVTQDLGEISGTMGQIADATAYMRPISEDLRAVAGNINDMNTNISHMQYNMWQLNRNVSAPFNMFEKMIPFGSSRPYGRSSSRITPPLYPRQPTFYAPQPVKIVPVSGNPANTPSAAQLTYTYNPYGYNLPLRRF
ncbi:MAG TPA: hypothetical protein ENI67_04145 [Gammaproteobacteria bacterium]|nr:hypothetical protein [Gammaproteobacteria bacterium]